MPTLEWSPYNGDMKPKTINASEFKAKCLKILDELDASGIVILKRGRPVARVLPISQQRPLDLVGSLKGKLKITGDIFRTGMKWDAKSSYE